MIQLCTKDYHLFPSSPVPSLLSNENSGGRSPSVVSAQKKLSTQSETLRINGVPYQFEFEGSDIHLMAGPANQRITVTLKRLPLYL